MSTPVQEEPVATPVQEEPVATPELGNQMRGSARARDFFVVAQ